MRVFNIRGEDTSFEDEFGADEVVDGFVVSELRRGFRIRGDVLVYSDCFSGNGLGVCTRVGILKVYGGRKLFKEFFGGV